MPGKKLPKGAPLPDVHKINRDAARYLRAQPFFSELYKFTDIITLPEMQRLKKLAKDGDIEGAWRGLAETLADHGYIMRGDERA
jgi:hypothetical protein